LDRVLFVLSAFHFQERKPKRSSTPVSFLLAVQIFALTTQKCCLATKASVRASMGVHGGLLVAARVRFVCALCARVRIGCVCASDERSMKDARWQSESIKTHLSLPLIK
jgi:hypothetical protein